uniref:Putative bpti/kunitz family of serine protease inhibitor n=1 Tax=Rhipicephalus microplus TaxID=6941 RepID=A0A6G5A7F2_RHIMP
MGLAVLSVVGKEEKGTKKKVKEASVVGKEEKGTKKKVKEASVVGKEEKGTKKKVKEASDNSICNKDFDSGPCFSSMPKYYYRTETKRCEMFVYGGCGGNENRFDTQKACQEKCGGG